MTRCLANFILSARSVNGCTLGCGPGRFGSIPNLADHFFKGYIMKFMIEVETHIWFKVDWKEEVDNYDQRDE